MTRAKYLQILRIGLPIFGVLSIVIAMELIASGGHLPTYLGGVCPESLPYTAFAKYDRKEHELCAELVAKVQETNNARSIASIFLFINFVVSAFFFWAAGKALDKE